MLLRTLTTGMGGFNVVVLGFGCIPKRGWVNHHLLDLVMSLLMWDVQTLG